MAVDLLLDAFGGRWTELRDAAMAAADAGFAGLWAFDHVDGRVFGARDVNLAELIALARAAHDMAAHARKPFLVTVFAELHDRWLRPDGPDRARLARLEVDRLVLFTKPPIDPAQIGAAGSLLGA